MKLKFLKLTLNMVHEINSVPQHIPILRYLCEHLVYTNNTKLQNMPSSCVIDYIQIVVNIITSWFSVDNSN